MPEVAFRKDHLCSHFWGKMHAIYFEKEACWSIFLRSIWQGSVLRVGGMGVDEDHYSRALREAVDSTLPVRPQLLLPSSPLGTHQWLGERLCGHLEEIMQCLRHHLPVEMTHDEPVSALTYLSSSLGHWISYVLNMRIWKKVWSLWLCIRFFYKYIP